LKGGPANLKIRWKKTKKKKVRPPVHQEKFGGNALDLECRSECVFKMKRQIKVLGYHEKLFKGRRAGT